MSPTNSGNCGKSCNTISKVLQSELSNASAAPHFNTNSSMSIKILSVR